MTAQPTVVCAGGAGPDQLTATLASVGASEVLCVPASPEERIACAGLARTITMDVWPGALAALESGATHAHGSPIALLAAGTLLRRGSLTRAADLLSRGAGVVIMTETRAQARALRARLRVLPRAALAPGSGVVLGGAAAAALRAHGWFCPDRAMSVETVTALAGPIRVLARGIRRAPATAPGSMTVTVLIPAHNEEAWIGHTLRSLERQSRKPDRVVVVDDGSSDRTGEIARSLGATVLRPSRRQGQKASALNYGLKRIDTDAVIVLDADTFFHEDAIAHLMTEIERGTDATCGAVLPLNERGLWARGRAVEYAVAIRIYKRIQEGLGSVLVLSGCISAFRTASLRAIGGFSERTITDDVDATWSLLTKGYKVSYTPAAVSYTVEPPSWALYKAQMRRWASGFFQTLPHYLKSLHRKPSLALLVGAAMWDVLTMPIFVGGTVVAMMAGKSHLSGMLAVWGGTALAVSTLAAASVIGFRRTLIGLPASLLMMWTNMYFFLEAFGRETILRRHSVAWVKGH